jgi:hypothetical protein
MAGNKGFAHWKWANSIHYFFSASFLVCSLWALDNEVRGMGGGPFEHNLYDSFCLLGLSIWSWYCGLRRYTRFCANIVLEAEMKERGRRLL